MSDARAPAKPATIRAAAPGDLPGLIELYRQLIGLDAPESHPDQEATFVQMLQHPGMTVFVADTGETLAATCTLIITPHLPRGCSPFALIENVVTHSDFRQKGHGQAVLDAAIRAAFEGGCYKVMLMTGSVKPGTHAFYEKAGFQRRKTGYEIRAAGVLPRKET